MKRLFILISLVMCAQAQAQQPQLEAHEAWVDLPTNELVVRGVHFDNGAALEVLFGNVPLTGVTLTVDSVLGVTELRAPLPVGFNPDNDAGTYTVFITSGGGSIRYDEIHVTVGNTGLQGPEGQQGPQGDPGADGQNGADGTSCSVSKVGDTATISCGDTTANVVDGAVGPAGADGADGAAGAPGEPGPAGADGLACWDLNGNGAQDQTEDINGDQVIDVLDCKGDKGDQGPQGVQGEQGPPGPPGSLAVNWASCPPGMAVTGFNDAGSLVCVELAPVSPSGLTRLMFRFTIDCQQIFSTSTCEFPGGATQGKIEGLMSFDPTIPDADGFPEDDKAAYIVADFTGINRGSLENISIDWGNGMESVSPGAYEFFINVNRIFKDPAYFPENPYYIEFLISKSINLRLRFIIRSLPSQYLLPAIPSQLEFNQMEFRKVEMTAMVVLSDGSVVNVELANSEPPDFKAPVVAEWGYFD